MSDAVLDPDALAGAAPTPSPTSPPRSSPEKPAGSCPGSSGPDPRCRLVTDHLGHLIDYGRTTYRPPKEHTEHVTTRDRTCRFPHCPRTATRSELDHIQPWADGGATNAGNLHALCPRHHHLKHQTPWQVRRTPDGHTHWTSPTGRHYRTPAATHPIDTTTTADPDPPPF